MIIVVAVAEMSAALRVLMFWQVSDLQNMLLSLQTLARIQAGTASDCLFTLGY